MRATLDFGKHRIIVTDDFRAERDAVSAVLRAGYRGELNLDKIMEFTAENIDRVTVEVLE